MQFLHAVFLFAVFLIAFQSEQLARNRTETGISSVFLGALVFLSVADALLAYYFRRKKLFPALEQLRRDPNDETALKDWRSANILNFVFTFSITLDGLVTRVLGGSRNVSWAFFLAALVLLAIWRPQLNAGAQVSGGRVD
jgi:uncharacterized membrane protein